MPSKSGRLSVRDASVSYTSVPPPAADRPIHHGFAMRRTLATVLLLFSIAPLTAADWPQWRGPNRDGVSTETGLLKEWPKAGPKLAWKADLGGVGYGSPVIVGDKLFICAAEDDKTGQK